jgi:hypothetical protein
LHPIESLGKLAAVFRAAIVEKGVFMLRFRYAVMVGSLFACSLFACGDKLNPKGNAPTTAGGASAGGATGQGGTTDIGGVDSGESEAGVAIDGGGGAGGVGGTAGGSGGAGGSTTATVSYSKTIAPIMAASCAVSGCHNSSDRLLGYAFDTYAGLKANVDVANSAIQDGSMPISPGAALTAADKKNFQDWVTAGSPNN